MSQGAAGALSSSPLEPVDAVSEAPPPPPLLSPLLPLPLLPLLLPLPLPPPLPAPASRTSTAPRAQLVAPAGARSCAPWALGMWDARLPASRLAGGAEALAARVEAFEAGGASSAEAVAALAAAARGRSRPEAPARPRTASISAAPFGTAPRFLLFPIPPLAPAQAPLRGAPQHFDAGPVPALALRARSARAAGEPVRKLAASSW